MDTIARFSESVNHAEKLLLNGADDISTQFATKTPEEAAEFYKRLVKSAFGQQRAVISTLFSEFISAQNMNLDDIMERMQQVHDSF